ncbi:MAG TPA: SDR family NAD(P)-dependent oxidoreductase [Pirellulaceae bacterium]|nr:SDR family NAD(P)-dependent oxidoreductase [Pirellulaceae bacterium]
MQTAGFWRSKCVIVTGASSGIGRAVALDLAGRGAKLGLIARREDALAAVASEIRAAGARAEYQAVDVAAAEPLAAAVRMLEESLGPCDIALANAGIYRKTEAAAFAAADASAVIATNVLGVSNLFAAVLPGMLARKSGRLAAVASIAGLLGLPGGGAYSASKAAVITLLQSLRLDLAPRGIAVTVILPGYVDTPMITNRERRTLPGLVTAEDAARRIARAIERGQGVAAFPWQTWLSARLAGLLPPGLFQFVMGSRPPLEEAPPASESPAD